MVNISPDVRPRVTTETRLAACRKKAITIVFSLPRRSESQPQDMRLPPFASGLSAAAVVSTKFKPVIADPAQVKAVSDQLMAQYKSLLTRGIRH